MTGKVAHKDVPGQPVGTDDIGIFIGYSLTSHAYKIYNKRLMTVEESVHVVFDEVCTALVVGSDDVASSYSIGVLTRRQVGRRGGSRGTRVVASY